MMTVWVRKESDDIGLHIYQVDEWFNDSARDEWYQDPIVQQIAKDIDNTDWVVGHIFKSPVLGYILAKELSGGAKTLIYILKGAKRNIPRVFRSARFGDNCVPWLAKLSYMCDFTLVMTHGLDLNIDGEICAQTEDGKRLNTCKEVWRYYMSETYKDHGKWWDEHAESDTDI